jgi:hypothetical protein
LEGDQVEAGDEFGDGVFDLETGVHLQEVKGAVGRGEELDGARAAVADRGRGGGGRGVQAFAHRRVDHRRRGLLDDLLVAALDGALALADRPDRAVHVGQDLHLDVPPGGQVGLAEHGRVAERRGGLGTGGLDLVGQVGEGAHDAHAPPAATGRGLDQHRQVGLDDGGRVEFGQHRHARGGHQLLRRDLRAHRVDGVR